MYTVVSVRQMKDAERRAKQYGLSEDVLIESAATALRDNIMSKTEPRDKIVVLCGGGNNGADGLSLARQLYLCGRKVRVYLTGGAAGPFAAARIAALNELGVSAVRAAADDIDLDCALIADCMIGTGLSREVSGELADIIMRVNASDAFTLAADVPSGLNADSGEVMGCAVIADQTVTFGAIKQGLLIGEGRNYCGELAVADIGIRAQSDVCVFDERELKLPARKAVSHKYNYGSVKIIAGSAEMPGASILAHNSAAAALRGGAGLACLCVPSSLAFDYRSRVTESMLRFLPDDGGKIIYDEAAIDALLPKTDAILIGPGMGDNEHLPRIIEHLAHGYGGVLVIDASALRALAADVGIIRGATAKIILTPHLGEFAALCKGNIIIELKPLTDQVTELAALLGCVIAAKGATTVISDGKKAYLNITGTPAMAKGGSGDVLAGLIAALACRTKPLSAAATACYRLGKSCEIAQRLYGSESVLASDLILKNLFRE